MISTTSDIQNHDFDDDFDDDFLNDDFDDDFLMIIQNFDDHQKNHHQKIIIQKIIIKIIIQKNIIKIIIQKIIIKIMIFWMMILVDDDFEISKKSSKS